MTSRRLPRLWPSKKALFTLHGWLGMTFGILLVWICLSGAIATLTHEIEWLTQPSLRINGEGPVRWQDTLDAVRAAYPDHHAKGFYRDEEQVSDGVAWIARLTAPDGSWTNVRVDPYEAKLVADDTRVSLRDVIRQTHYQFFDHQTPWGLGFYLVTLIAVPMLLSMISALLFFKRWWRHLFRLRLGKGVRAFVSSLHRVTGVWTLIFGLIIAVTSLWYLIEAHLPYEIAYPSAPSVSEERLAAHGPTPPALPLERYITAARAAFPELSPTGISLPGSVDGTVEVEGQAGGILVRDRANAVFLDPHGASVVAIRDSAQGGALSWWINSADSLHFGYWGGLASKILWALFGLCLPVMVLSGAYLSWRRAGIVGPGNPLRSRPRNKHLPWWRRRPTRTWIMLPLTAAIVVSVVIGYEKRTQSPEPFVEIGTVDIGPWEARMIRESGAAEREAVQYAVAFDAGPDRAVNLRRATLGYRKEADDDANAGSEAVELRGATHAMRGALPVPAELRGDTRLRLSAETWDGDRFQATVPESRPHTIPEQPRRYAPAAPGVFYAIVLGYAVIALLVAIVWWFLDTAPPPVRRRESRTSP